MKTKVNKTGKAKDLSTPFFYKSPRIEYVWFAYVDLRDGQGKSWHETDFKEESVERANNWRTSPCASDVFDKPTILVRRTVSWQPLNQEQYSTMSMSKEERQKADLVEWSKRKCIFGRDIRKLCTPSRYFDCLQCRR